MLRGLVENRYVMMKNMDIRLEVMDQDISAQEEDVCRLVLQIVKDKEDHNAVVLSLFFALLLI